MPGAVCDVETLITINKYTLSYLAEHKDWCSRDSPSWANVATDWEIAVEVLELLIDKLGQQSIDKVVIWDDLSDSNYYPCPRFLPIMEMDGGRPIFNITAKRIPYFKAKKMYENGEWDGLADIQLTTFKVNKVICSDCDLPF